MVPENNPNSSPDQPTILYAVEKRVATITLNRPEKRNALGWTELDQFNQYLVQATNDSAVKAIRIKSAGDKTFCAGLDLSMISTMTPKEFPRLTHTGDTIVRNMIQCKKPIIAQVQGSAPGFGCMICCASDFILASNKSEIYFSLPEIEVGIFPATGALLLGYSRMGINFSKQMLLLAKKIPLEIAMREGLVTEIFSPEELEQKSFDFCRELTKKSPAILNLSKAILNKIHFNKFEQVFQWENEALELCKSQNDSDWDQFVKKIWENK